MKEQTHTDLAGTTCSAIFSDDMTRRFLVEWRWKPGPILTACLLNPAMLEVDEPDHTGAGIVARARKWGFCGARIVNPFTIRTKDPAVMLAHPDPIGPDADRFILEAMRQAFDDGSPFIVGWGKDGAHRGRDREVLALAQRVGLQLMAFKLNNDGSPTHPARLGYDLRPVIWPAA